MVSRNSKRIASRSQKRFVSHVSKGRQQRIQTSMAMRRITRAVCLNACGLPEHLDTWPTTPVGKWFRIRIVMPVWEPAVHSLLTGITNPSMNRWNTGTVSQEPIRIDKRAFLRVAIHMYKRSSTALQMRAVRSNAMQLMTRIPVRIVTGMA